jgi:hypothetical protein
MRDWEVIKETLAELGCPKDAIREHDSPVELKGYPGDRAQHASIVIRGGTIGAGNRYDIGFEKEADGSYRAYVNDMDRGGISGDIRRGRLKRLYSKNVTVRTVKRQGWRIASCEEEGGQIKLKVLQR